jgi:phosphoribosylglycinamide formyltransferase-1
MYTKIAGELQARNVGLVVLAGFMRIVGKPLINAFPNRIMNIHPALLPSFPGLHGQKQALDYGVKISGCTVHFVDEGMDTGPIIIQAAVPVYHHDTEETLSERILKLEHKIYPEAIRLFAEGKLQVDGRIVRITDGLNSDQSVVNPPLKT